MKDGTGNDKKNRDKGKRGKNDRQTVPENK